MTAKSNDARPSATEESRRRAVVGVGSMVLGDDGVGYHAIEALQEHDGDLPAGTTLTHAGTTAFLALEAMSGADLAIVVDALAIDESPGTIREYRLDRPDTSAPEVTMHDYSFTDALAVGDAAYDVPEEVYLIGVVPERLEPAVELSEPVETALPELVSRIERRLVTETDH
ncbi:hydrogenase maturation protease [Halobiforma haloterrestris]|uniref:Hydrogenase maturation protease n=1 Tax=Natronobacterium haloterrestre TaxID=148448 RepID=A0A1I1JL46_NATHA|nr:hydrogenase maturation protease [Halobiforma haloterrestris]SFC49206.1 hydrogenase maturation protease [Halobiforma haloterrestris]